jgi:hypothetical protein
LKAASPGSFDTQLLDNAALELQISDAIVPEPTAADQATGAAAALSVYEAITRSNEPGACMLEAAAVAPEPACAAPEPAASSEATAASTAAAASRCGLWPIDCSERCVWSQPNVLRSPDGLEHRCNPQCC